MSFHRVLLACAAAALAAPCFAPRARAQDLTPDKTVDAPTPPAPASRSGGLWAALATCQKGISLDEVLAATGYAFRATACANDCPCIEWREDALAIAPAARLFAWADHELDVAHAAPESGFAVIKAEIDAGRAPFYAAPREVGVVYGYKEKPKTFFVHAVIQGEARDEARSAEALAELWDLHTFTPNKTPAYEPAALENRALLEALAHARRPPARGGCGFLEAPAVDGYGLSAYQVFAQRLATDDRGISGTHGAVPDRVAHLRAARAAAVRFLDAAAKRRDNERAGAGAPFAAAAKEYRAEVDECLAPLEMLTGGKDELALADDTLRQHAARFLAKAAEHDRSALALIEKVVLTAHGVASDLHDVLSIARTAPVPEKRAPELAELAANGEADLRLIAVDALGDTPGAAAHAALARALLDKDGPVSDAALVALEARDEDGLVDTLLDAWDKAPRVRVRSDRPLQRALVFSLADHASRDPRALKALEKALEDQGEGDDIPDSIPRWAAASLYAVQGVDAEPALLAAMKSARATARRAAAGVLDLSGSKEALAALEVALADADPGTRLAAAQALGRRGEEKGIKVAVAALRDPSRDVRSLGVEALTRMKAAAHLALVKLLEDPDWRIRGNACVVLGRTGTTKELEKVAALEKDPAPQVRELALQAKAVVAARARAEEKKK